MNKKNIVTAIALICIVIGCWLYYHFEYKIGVERQALYDKITSISQPSLIAQTNQSDSIEDCKEELSHILAYKDIPMTFYYPCKWQKDSSIDLRKPFNYHKEISKTAVAIYTIGIRRIEGGFKNKFYDTTEIAKLFRDKIKLPDQYVSSNVIIREGRPIVEMITKKFNPADNGYYNLINTTFIYNESFVSLHGGIVSETQIESDMLFKTYKEVFRSWAKKSKIK